MNDRSGLVTNADGSVVRHGLGGGPIPVHTLYAVPDSPSHSASAGSVVATGANFAHVGKRTTGTAAGDFLLCEPGWSGDTPDGMTRIDVPHRAALLVGRVFVADEDDRPAAYALAKQIQLSPPAQA